MMKPTFLTRSVRVKRELGLCNIDVSTNRSETRSMLNSALTWNSNVTGIKYPKYGV